MGASAWGASAWRASEWVQVNGCKCMGASAWLQVYGCKCVSASEWVQVFGVQVYGCKCMGCKCMEFDVVVAVKCCVGVAPSRRCLHGAAPVLRSGSSTPVGYIRCSCVYGVDTCGCADS